MIIDTQLNTNSPIEVYRWFERHEYFSNSISEDKYGSFGFKTVARFMKDVYEFGIPNSELTFRMWLKVHNYEII